MATRRKMTISQHEMNELEEKLYLRREDEPMERPDYTRCGIQCKRVNRFNRYNTDPYKHCYGCIDCGWAVEFMVSHYPAYMNDEIKKNKEQMLQDLKTSEPCGPDPK